MMTLRAQAIVWAALIASVGIAGVWIGYPIDPLWRWLAALLIAALVFEYLSVRSAHLGACLTERTPARLGRSSSWQLRITNHGAQPWRMRIAVLPPDSFSGSVAATSAVVKPGETHVTEFSQIPQQLGPHRWPPQPVELRGPFGLADWIRKLPPLDGDGPAASDAVTVVEPNNLEQSRQRAALDRAGSRAVPVRSIGGNEFRSLRDYAQGDAPSSIDWKSTARTGRLTVKETDVEQQLLLYFMIDSGRTSGLRIGDLSAVGHAVNLAARMSQVADRAGDRYGLLCYADEPLARLKPARGLSHQHRMRELLTNVAPVASESNPLAAVFALSKLLPQRALVLMFTHLDDAEASGQLARATMLLRPQHLPMIVSVEDRSIREMARQPAVDADGVYLQLAAREYRRTVGQARARLERLGAIVIEAPPERIEERVFERYRQLRINRSV